MKVEVLVAGNMKQGRSTVARAIERALKDCGLPVTRVDTTISGESDEFPGIIEEQFELRRETLVKRGLDVKVIAITGCSEDMSLLNWEDITEKPRRVSGLEVFVACGDFHGKWFITEKIKEALKDFGATVQARPTPENYSEDQRSPDLDAVVRTGLVTPPSSSLQ